MIVSAAAMLPVRVATRHAATPTRMCVTSHRASGAVVLAVVTTRVMVVANALAGRAQHIVSSSS